MKLITSGFQALFPFEKPTESFSSCMARVPPREKNQHIAQSRAGGVIKRPMRSDHQKHALLFRYENQPSRSQGRCIAAAGRESLT